MVCEMGIGIGMERVGWDGMGEGDWGGGSDGMIG